MCVCVSFTNSYRQWFYYFLSTQNRVGSPFNLLVKPYNAIQRTVYILWPHSLVFLSAEHDYILFQRKWRHKQLQWRHLLTDINRVLRWVAWTCNLCAFDSNCWHSVEWIHSRHTQLCEPFQTIFVPLLVGSSGCWFVVIDILCYQRYRTRTLPDRLPMAIVRSQSNKLKSFSN